METSQSSQTIKLGPGLENEGNGIVVAKEGSLPISSGDVIVNIREVAEEGADAATGVGGDTSANKPFGEKNDYPGGFGEANLAESKLSTCPKNFTRVEESSPDISWRITGPSLTSPDLERGPGSTTQAPETAPPAIPSGNAESDDDDSDQESLFGHKSQREQIVEKIWKGVVDRPIRTVKVWTQEDFEDAEYQTSLHAKCRSSEDLHLLFQYEDEDENEFEKKDALREAQEHAAVLHYFVEARSQNKHAATPFNYGVLALCAKTPYAEIGEILDDCFRYGSLQQPEGTDKSEYQQHILTLVDAALLLNNIFTFVPDFRTKRSSECTVLSSVFGSAQKYFLGH